MNNIIITVVVVVRVDLTLIEVTTTDFSHFGTRSQDHSVFLLEKTQSRCRSSGLTVHLRHLFIAFIVLLLFLFTCCGIGLSHFIKDNSQSNAVLGKIVTKWHKFLLYLLSQEFIECSVEKKNFIVTQRIEQYGHYFSIPWLMHTWKHSHFFVQAWNWYKVLPHWLVSPLSLTNTCN